MGKEINVGKVDFILDVDCLNNTGKASGTLRCVMVAPPIYLDNHATTRVDPRVVEAMLPFFTAAYGNAGSTTHVFGGEAREAVDAAREQLAAAIGAAPREIIFTSGATESNNLALRGAAERLAPRGKHFITVATEHKAVLDVAARLETHGWEVTRLGVIQNGERDAGRVRVDDFLAAIRPDTTLASVMLANNEIGVIQPIAELAAICRERNIVLHTDAAQAAGKIPLDVARLEVDLLSFTAHKIYGPKGIGALYVRKRSPAVRLVPQIDGGGQETGLRSGTLNVPGIAGFAAAMELCLADMAGENVRLAELREKLWSGLAARLVGVSLNGPAFDEAIRGENPPLRLPGNLNVCFGNVEGEAIMLNLPEVAMSSGSACTSVNPEPSHVLRALSLSDDQARSSLRFGLGRFTTAAEIDYALDRLADTVNRLRELTAPI